MSVISHGASSHGTPSTQLQIRTGGFDVVVSGTVITANNNSLEFQLAQLGVIFSFVTDGGDTRLGKPYVSGSSLNLTLYNFNNSIGSGTTLPIEIGKLYGKKLWLSFMVYALSPESSKTVHYTFMVGGPA